MSEEEAYAKLLLLGCMPLKRSDIPENDFCMTLWVDGPSEDCSAFEEWANSARCPHTYHRHYTSSLRFWGWLSLQVMLTDRIRYLEEQHDD